MKGLLLEKFCSYMELDKKHTKILILVAEAVWFLDEIKDGDIITALLLGSILALTLVSEYNKKKNQKI